MVSDKTTMPVLRLRSIRRSRPPLLLTALICNIRLTWWYSIFQESLGEREARSYVVTIDRAWGLAKADRFGKCDPFVSVKVKDRVVSNLTTDSWKLQEQ